MACVDATGFCFPPITSEKRFKRPSPLTFGRVVTGVVCKAIAGIENRFLARGETSSEAEDSMESIGAESNEGEFRDAAEISSRTRSVS